MHIEYLVEEPSLEAFLRIVLPKIIEPENTFEIYVFQGKHDLLSKLENRLSGYRRWIGDSVKVVVVVDRDGDDCILLKRRIVETVHRAGLIDKSSGDPDWNVATRIICEELEAWYFGDWDAVTGAFPRVSPLVRQRAGFRDSDNIGGGTWEAFERVLQSYNYYSGGLAKIEAARLVGDHFNPNRCDSSSWGIFRDLF